MSDNEEFLRRFGTLSDEQWIAKLVRSTKEPLVDGVAFPSFPDGSLQRSFVGADGEEALREAFVFYQEIKSFAAKLQIPIDRYTRALDFGCGWGRIYRFFLRELRTENLLGVDVDPGCIELCRRTIPVGRFEQCGSLPPLAASDSSVDLIYAYSVFSHLSEGTALAWVREFRRILRTGGMLIATTLKRAHIDVWEGLSQSGKGGWRNILRAADFSASRFRADFEAGKFLYCATGGGKAVLSADFYGEAIIPPVYVLRSWPSEFQLYDYVSENMRGPQAIIVVRKSS